MFSERAFFSFVDVTDPKYLPVYHDWQLYDHLPENRALPGVAWGDRWTRLADADSVERCTDGFSGVDSMTMYWFRAPYERSIAEWDRLAIDSVHWGRGPAVPSVVRRFMGFFAPLKGYVAARTLVSEDVLPYCPNRGVHVTLSRIADPLGAEAHELYRWYDREHLPELLDVPGVMGGWTFRLTQSKDPFWPEGGEPRVWAEGEVRARVLYLDEDPIETAAAIAEHEAQGGGSGPGSAEEVLFAAPLATVVPFAAVPRPAG
ncbi:hypothetical protein [Sciscionella marina]|uniref:hypothetical protein n=1 Tax=Sciscionella marina TaxID=508770 RepID=UPI000368D223|nr:hypothetical protein [Sciscionella marina]